MRPTLALVCCVLAACGDDDGNGVRADAQQLDAAPSQMIGPAGGTVTVPGGPTVTVPAGALNMAVTITITATTDQIAGAVTPVYLFEPEGLTFFTPATVSFPVANQTGALRVFWSNPTPGYDELASTQTVTAVSASIDHFSKGYVAPAIPAVATGDHHPFVVATVGVPTTNTQSREWGLDLDGDQTVDNQLGMVFATLGSMGFDIQGTTNSAVDRGNVLVLADLQTTNFISGTSAGLRTYLGATPQPAPCTNGGDVICRKHLAGSGTFTVASNNPNNGYLVGNTVSGTLLSTSGGHAVFQMALNPNRPLTFNMIGARAKVSGASASGITTGVIAGGITQAELDATIFPEFVLSASDAVAADCTMLSSPPTCGCADNTSGKTWLGLFDVGPKDCSVSLTEVKNNSLIVSLFALDLVLEGQEALSVGFGFTAVPGTFTP